MFLLRALRILKDALLAPSLSLSTRLHLLLLQPISLLTYTIEWSRGRRFPHSHEIWIPLRRAPGHTLRAVVYLQPGPKVGKRPLHLNIHGGGFLGGLPEGTARFCWQLAQRSGAVVVSTSYRYAPVHTFPDAHEDVQDVAEYLVRHAEEMLDADPACFTVSGFSAGGNLALGVAQGLAGARLKTEAGREVLIRGSVSFYGVVCRNLLSLLEDIAYWILDPNTIKLDLRLPPWEKPIPQGFPEKDPLSFLQPLFDAYAGPNRARDIGNPLLHPTLADIKTLPQNMLFVVGDKDILYDETVATVRRLEEEEMHANRGNGIVRGQSEDVQSPDRKKVVVKMEVLKGQIHGWLELPSVVIDVNIREKVYGAAISFLKDVHRAYGFDREGTDMH
ncbi:Alpha/Beta hydrolase protein [Aspergillus recurvatus]